MRRWRAGISVLATAGRNPSPSTCSISLRNSVALMVPPTRPVPLPRMVTGLFLGLGIRIQQLFFGHAAVVPQGLELAAVEARALFGQALRNRAGQRQVDVVAAQQNVLAHGHAVERQFAPALGDRDQREVGGAAADIHHQDQIAHLHALAPVGVAFDPGIEGGLRLFEQA